MPTYEMLWDCTSCGTRKLLGKSHRRCPNCGAAQDAKKRYFPPPGEEVAVEGHVFVGVDWTCGACQTPNSRAAEFCVNCGNPREGNADVRLVTEAGPAADSDQAPAEPPSEPSTARPMPSFRFAAETREAEEAEREAATGARRGFKGRIAAGVTSLLIGFGALTALWTKDVEVAVERHEWVREIDVERMAARADSAWCDSMPGDAYNVTRTREERSRNQVADGEECHDVRRDNGDGTFSTSTECRTKYRSEPVYDDRCHYTVNRWGLERTARNTGFGLFPEPSWPSTYLRAGSCLGCEKEGERREILTVALRDRGDRSNSWRCDIDQPRWRMLGDGQLLRIKVRVITGGAVCDSVQP